MQPDGFDRLDVRRALALVLIFAVAYLFSTGGHAYSVDEITNLRLSSIFSRIRLAGSAD